MASGNAQIGRSRRARTTSGNTLPGRRSPLPAPSHEEVLGDYATSLRSAPLAPSTRAKYLSGVRGFLDWVAGADVEGDPLTDAAARDWAVRDYRDHLKRRRARPTTINNVLAALDDFYRRGGLGPAQARREDIAPPRPPPAPDPPHAPRYL